MPRRQDPLGQIERGPLPRPPAAHRSEETWPPHSISLRSGFLWASRPEVPLPSEGPSDRAGTNQPGQERDVAYRIRIDPPTSELAETIFIQDAAGDLLLITTIRESAIAWLIAHGCWLREADLLQDYQYDTVYWITADRDDEASDVTN